MGRTHDYWCDICGTHGQIVEVQVLLKRFAQVTHGPSRDTCDSIDCIVQALRQIANIYDKRKDDDSEDR